MIEENLRPRPVSVTTPTMMPAAAQVAATFSTPVVPARIAEASSGVLPVARLLQHRPGDRADGDRRRHTRARGSPEQERGEHDRPARARGFPAEEREGEVEEEAAGARVVQERAVDHEE